MGWPWRRSAGEVVNEALPESDDTAEKRLDAELEELRLAEARRLTALVPEIEMLYRQQHEDDKAAFKFNIERANDYITFRIDRMTSPGKITSHVGSVNFRNAHLIQFHEGKSVRSEAMMCYEVLLFDPGKSYAYSPTIGYGPAPKGARHEVRGVVDDAEKAANFRRDVVSGKSGHVDYDYYHGWCTGRRLYGHDVSWPRRALDDRVEFLGASVTLHAPHGLGGELYAAIINAIAAPDLGCNYPAQ